MCLNGCGQGLDAQTGSGAPDVGGAGDQLGKAEVGRGGGDGVGGLSRRRFASQAEARTACFSFLVGYNNPARLHSGLGYRSPMPYEADIEAALTKQ